MPENFNADINPLDEPVNEKRYTQANINTSNVDLNVPIEEPRFQAPPFEQPKVKQEYKKPEPVNPELNNVSKKDKDMASAQAAQLIMGGYKMAHELANKALRVPEKKLMKLVNDGEINLNIMIDYDYGKKMRAGDFFKDYNNQIDGVLTVSPEFEAEVTPVLERVLSKRGIGMTDEQFLIYLFGKDIASKAMIFFQLKAQMNFMIESMKQATANQVYGQQQQAPPPPPPAPSQPQPEADPEPAPKPIMSVVKIEPKYSEPEEAEVDNNFEPINK